MKINFLSFILSVIFCVGFISCKKQSPQLPSNKGIEKDKNVTSLLAINRDLTIKEDNRLRIFTESKGFYKKNELGFWYKIYKTGKGPVITDSATCNFDFKLKKLDGNVLQTGNKQIVIGKKQLVVGLEEGLKLMHKGDSAIFVIPWYLGYGMTGYKPLIPPYTSLIYEIKLLN